MQNNLVVSRIRFYFTFVLSGLLIAILFHYSMRRFFGLGYPWNTFLLDPSDRFNDWYNSVFSAATMDPYYKHGVAISTYFPFAYVLLQVGSFFSRRGSLLVYLASSIGLLMSGIVIFWRIYLVPKIDDAPVKFWSVGLFISSVAFCYPLIFALDRGNIDTWVAGLCLIYVVLLRTQYNLLGFLAIGIAIAIKGYPAAFLLLGMVDKQYRLVLWAIIVSIALTFYSLHHFSGGFLYNLHGFRQGLQDFRNMYVLGAGGIGSSADPYNGIRTLLMMFNPAWLSGNIRLVLLQAYDILALFFAGISVYFILFVSVPRWRQVLATCLLAVLFPDVIMHYKLLVLLPGVFMLFTDADNSKQLRRSLIYLAILMIPKSYLYIKGISVSGIINPIFLVLLVWNVFDDKVAWIDSFKEMRFNWLNFIAHRRAG